jgi:large subunit ribosomal protein L24e
MVERRVCTFCGEEIEPGTGRMYIKKDGIVYNFCTSKCYKNMILMGRVPRRTTWTQYYAREKQIRMKGAPAPVAEAPKKARKVKKAEGEQEQKPEKKEEAVPKQEKPEAEEKKPAPKEAPKKVQKKAAGAKKPEGAKTEKPKPRPEPKEKPEEGSGA